MEDRLNKYLIISLIIHIFLLLFLLQFINLEKLRIPQPMELELLEISDISIPPKATEDIPKDSALLREDLRDISDMALDDSLMTVQDIDDEDIIMPVEVDSITIQSKISVPTKDKVIMAKRPEESVSPPPVTDDLLKLETMYREQMKQGVESDYEIISKELEGRKIINRGDIPKNLTFSKSERVVLNFYVGKDGIVENIIPEAIVSGENLDIAINILNQFRWEPINEDKRVEAKIIFYFKVR